MSVIDEKLKRFENLIFSDVDAQINAANADIDAYRQTTLAKHREKLIDEYFFYMQDQVKQIKAQVGQQLSKEELDAQRELLHYRNELVERVFSAVRERLANYTASAKYPSYLIEHIKSSLADSPKAAYELLVRQADLPLLEEADLPSTVTIAVDQSIQLGGFILLSQELGIMLDRSFDSGLGELVTRFNQTSGLTIA